MASFSRHANSLRHGLAAYWRLNEIDGAALSHDGAITLADNATVTQGVGVGNMPFARQFTAANKEFLSVADNEELSIGVTSFTFCAWFLADALGVNQAIITKGDDATHLEYRIRSNSSNGIALLVSDGVGGTVVSVSSTIALTAGVWHFICTGYSQAQNVGFIRVNQERPVTAAGSGTAANGTNTFRIGSINTVSAQNWGGRICGVGKWNRILHSAEMDWLYNNGRGRYVV